MTRSTHGKQKFRQQTGHHAELDQILAAVTEYAHMFGIPVPPMDKMEKMIRSVSHDIERIFVNNKSKKPVQNGDILVLMLKMGLITLVALPLIKMIVSEGRKKAKDGKARIETESMVD